MKKSYMVIISILGAALCLCALFLVIEISKNSNLIKEQQSSREEINQLESSLEKQKEEKEELADKVKTQEQNMEEKAQKEETETRKIEEEETKVQAETEIQGVNEMIENVLSKRAATGEEWRVSVKILSGGQEVHYGTGKMTAASLIKLYIMGAVYEKYDAIISANDQETVDQLLRAMITVSDNEAANELTLMLGNGDAKKGRMEVTSFCSRMGFEDTSMGRMLLDTQTDQENYTSPEDCCKFLEQVYEGALEKASSMLSLLKQQERTQKIPAGIPEGVETANKTGELATVENDAAIIFNGEEPYILCIMSESLTDTKDARQTIVELSGKVYACISKEK